MSDISLTLVLQFKTSKIINDMAKVQIKSEKVTPFGGIFHVRELFSRYMAPIIDTFLLYSKIISKYITTWQDWCYGIPFGRSGREVQADYEKPSSRGRKRALRTSYDVS